MPVTDPLGIAVGSLQPPITVVTHEQKSKKRTTGSTAIILLT
jgi:hypothetical protein